MQISYQSRYEELLKKKSLFLKYLVCIGDWGTMDLLIEDCS